MLTSLAQTPILKTVMNEHIAYIGVGSNLGDRPRYVSEAIRLLGEHPRVKISALSHCYETEPLTLKGERQNYYLNCVIKINTTMNAVRLFQVMQEIEKILGRVRNGRWEPRTIDLDLLLFDDDIIRTKQLNVPHPQLHHRRFVLEPLAELNPKLNHPIKGVSIQQLLHRLKDDKKVVPLYKFHMTHPIDEVMDQSS